MAALRPWCTVVFSLRLARRPWPFPWQRWPQCTLSAAVCFVTNMWAPEILPSVRSIDGLPISHPLRLAFGVYFKVRYQRCSHCCFFAHTHLGWLTVFAWVVNCAGPPAIIANIITALAVFNYETYQLKSWHTMLIMWGLILVPFVFNLWFRQLLNTFELVGGLLHIIFFISSIITLVVLARRSTADFVFNTLTTGQSGWNNPGVSWGLGLLTVTFAVSGA